MQFDIITIFPRIFDSFLKESLIKKALKKGLIKIRVHNLRKWAKDRYKTVDDKPFGGGRGMVLKIEPIYRAVQSLKSKSKSQKSEVIFFTPRGKKFNQKMAYRFSKLNQIILICGHYEGVDERVAKYIADEKISIGDYILMGGEVPALAVIEATSRLISRVVGKSELLKQRITREKGFIEYPQYTRPEIFEPKKKIKWIAPKVLLSGNHKKIEEWRKKRQKIIE